MIDLRDAVRAEGAARSMWVGLYPGCGVHLYLMRRMFA